MLPGVARPVLAAAETAGVRAIRNPFEPGWSLATGHGARSIRLKLRMLYRLRPRFLALPPIRDGRILTTDGTIGIAATGSLDAANLLEMLQALPDGVWELLCHPGYNDGDLDAVTTRLRASRETEREALLATFASNYGSPHNHPLISYREAGSQQ
jgi:hypothetical protein